jgi:hypothetical protein
MAHGVFLAPGKPKGQFGPLARTIIKSVRMDGRTHGGEARQTPVVIDLDERIDQTAYWPQEKVFGAASNSRRH